MKHIILRLLFRCIYAAIVSRSLFIMPLAWWMGLLRGITSRVYPNDE